VRVEARYDVQRVIIWDTAGQEQFHSITELFYRGADGVLLVYDVTTRSSYDSMSERWLVSIRSKLPESVPIWVVGNKIDLTPNYNNHTVMEWAKDNRLHCVFTSAATRQGVDETLRGITDAMINASTINPEPDPSLQPPIPIDGESHCCSWT
jgi:small GTP-binding protein